MQKGSFTPSTPRYDTNGTVNRINSLADRFRKQNLPVIYIQHDGNGSGTFEKNTTEWEILDDLEVNQTDILIDKYANDVFYKSNLAATLKSHDIKELYITGCATDFCVEATIQSAITKEFDITVVADGHTTGERPHLSAKDVITHYNWVWQHMIPTQGSITVQSLEEIIKKL
ncbi:isochorismatase [Roseivirga misakiensis]|uniref:Isochorismatase n=2 Tax=Roseivirga misakiensis TaxID=1563681 RepID=A0A1E5T2H0_9BACT|nr:isochorismatase [Roseivirga misakiensis]